MVKEKICPLMGKVKSSDEQGNVVEVPSPCFQGMCSFWVHTYTNENERVECCAIEAIALRDDSGRYRV
jgi:hypothetical protein